MIGEGGGDDVWHHQIWVMEMQMCEVLRGILPQARFKIWGPLDKGNIRGRRERGRGVNPSPMI
jgi:hypothetical protein